MKSPLHPAWLVTACIVLGSLCSPPRAHAQLRVTRAAPPAPPPPLVPVPILLTGPDDKCYQLAIVHGMGALGEPDDDDDDHGPPHTGQHAASRPSRRDSASLPETLVLLESGATAVAGPVRWQSDVTLCYLQAGLDLQALGDPARGGYYGGGFRLDLDPFGSRRHTMNWVRSSPPPRASAAPASRAALIRENVRPMVELPRVVLAANYRDYDWQGKAYTASLTVSWLRRLGPASNPAGLRFALIPQYLKYSLPLGSTEARLGTLVLEYEDRYPEADGAIARWHWELGAHFTPRNAAADGSIAGLYAKIRIGPEDGRGPTQAMRWRDLAARTYELTVGVGVGPDRKGYAGLRVTKAIP